MSGERCSVCDAPLPPGVREEFCPLCLLREAAAPGTTQPALPAGVRSIGDYDLLGEIARGGMGVVFKARQRSLGRIVAVKLLLGGHHAGPEARARFNAEATVAAGLQHPNIVAIHEIGDFDGQPYFSMEYIEGSTLAEILRDGPLPARRAARYVALVARAVAFAHSKGILHRDLKPSNVLIDLFDQPRTTDFGLAKFLDARPDSTLAQLTASGQVMGSPAYVPPEVVRGDRPTGPLGDVYSLGALLYHLVAGRAPFQGETLASVLRQVLDTEPVPPRRQNPSLPRDLETICLKCLEKDPARRYESASLLAVDLERFLAGQPVLARPVGWPGRGWRWARRHPFTAGLGVALHLALAGLVAGGVLAGLRILKAERAATANLREARLEQARVMLLSEEMGHRLVSQELIRQGLSLGATADYRARARDLFIATLPFEDGRFVPAATLPAGANAALPLLDPGLRYLARVTSPTQLTVTRLADGQVTRRLEITPGPIVALDEFSPDSRFLVVRLPREITVWDLETGLMVEHSPGTRVVMAFSPDSRRLVIEEKDVLSRVVSLPEGEVVSRFEPSPDPPDAPSRGWLAFAFSPDSQRLAGARVQSNLVQVMDLATSRVLHEWGSAEAVTALAWDPTGRVVVTGNRVGQVVGTELPGLTHAFDLSVTRGGVRDLAVSPDGKFLAVSGEDRVIRCLSLDRLQAAFVTHGDAAKLAFTADGRRLGAIIKHDEAGWIELVESESYAARRVGQTSGAVTDFCLTEPGPLIACASPTGLRLLRAGDLMPVGTSRVGPVRGIAFQPSVASLWMAADEGILRWRVKDVIEGIQAFTAPVQRVLEGRHWADVALNSDGRLMALALDVPGEIRLCDPASPAKPALVLRHAGADFVTFSPDTRWLATGSSAERRIRVWSLPDGTPELEVIAGLHPMAAFSPDGRWLATYGENFTLRDTHRWQVIPLPDFGRERPTPGLVAFSPDNRVLALLLDQQVIQLLRLPDLQPLAALRMPRLARAHQMAFSADARLLLVSGSDATLLCWRLPEVRARLAGAGLDWED